ncbi:hypothetical protein RFN28_33430 [Mesorhizobium sp. VK24D]|uniref:Uncharacterized protein n=1 Tax=Mesorhizobium album TaxID=3072314 RepID=A0ABU4Y8P2_9HYPH|nr:hypothetical protein [Mesorhizobium sp. VK24D]MDX8483314.1 hypothetical protein [Mesorhizobium sp. VK24D]
MAKGYYRFRESGNNFDTALFLPATPGWLFLADRHAVAAQAGSVAIAAGQLLPRAIVAACDAQ